MSDRCGEFADIALINSTTKHIFVTDVVVFSPNMEYAAHWDGDVVMADAVAGKRALYAKWDIDEEDLVPLAFSSYLATETATLEWLRDRARVLASGDRKLAGTYFRRIRDWVAMVLVVGQGRLITELNRKNRLRGSSRRS